MSLPIAKGIFTNKVPNVVLDQIYFDSHDQHGNQVSLELVYQIPAEWTTVSPYKVMVVLSNNANVVTNFTQQPALAKQAILDEDVLYPSNYVKMYMPGDLSGEVSQFSEGISLGGGTAGGLVQKRRTIFLPPIPAQYWPDMYLYAIAYRADPQAQTPSGLIGTTISSLRVGSPLSETIYMGNNPSDLAFVYTLAESFGGYGNKGDLWSGPVHRAGGAADGGSRLMAGEFHGDHAHPSVAITTVSNQKTVDARILRAQEQAFAHMAGRASFLNARMVADAEAARNITGPAPNGLTPATFSRTTNGIVKTIFSVNYTQLVQANTKMNFLFSNKEALDGCFEVENMRLFRTRVKSHTASNKLTPGKLNICGAGRQGTPKLVATLQDNTINAVSYKNQSVGITTYVGNDRGMAGIDGGVYEYTLYIDAVDNSAAAVNYVAEHLKTALTAYDGWISQNFYAVAGGQGTNASQRLRDLSDTLRQNGSREDLVDAYLSALIFIFGMEPFQSTSLISWRKNLLAMSNPSNGSLTNMRAVSTLVRQLYTHLNQAANPSTVGANSNTFSVRSHMATSSPAVRRIALKNVFPVPYTQRFSPSTGFDFLDDRLTDPSPGLSGMSYAKYQTRIANELGKYNTNANGAIVTGFLTPARIRTPTNIIDTRNEAIGLNNTVDLFAAKERPQTPQLSFHTSNPQGGDGNKGTQADVQQLLSIGGLTAEPLVLDIKTIRELSTPTAADAAALNSSPSSEFFGTGSLFNSDNAAELANLSGSTEQNLLYSNPNSNDPTVSILHSGLVMTLIDSQLKNFSQQTSVMTEGIQGSLGAQKISQDPSFIARSNAATVAINFNSIKQIQYFQGYTTAPGGNLIDSPRWSILTQTVFDSARATGEPLLCRIQDTQAVTNSGNKLELPGYDNLFILGDPASTVTSRAYTPYVSYYGLVVNWLHARAKETAVNTSTPFSNVKPFLIRVPIMTPYAGGSTPAADMGDEVPGDNSGEGVVSNEEDGS